MIVNRKNKVVVGISGGVDSAVATWLLREAGLAVTAVHMRLWGETGSLVEAMRRTEENAARQVAERLGVEFQVWDLTAEFKQLVVDEFVRTYAAGLTPNPCIQCNRKIKFGLFWQKAQTIGAEFIATGHYARVVKKRDGKRSLCRAVDVSKDQSYFLYNLSAQDLEYVLFPLGEFNKKQVRAIAKQQRLPNFQKAESQEVCFLTDKFYGDFLVRQGVEMQPGEIVNETGRVLGQHRGLPYYTLGQRRDLRVGGTGPYYVIEIDRLHNRVVVSRDSHHSKLLKQTFILISTHWLNETDTFFPLQVEVELRYHARPLRCTVRKKAEGEFMVELADPAMGVTPGQSAVFYRGEEILGGGVIKG